MLFWRYACSIWRYLVGRHFFGQELGLKSQFAGSPTDTKLKNAFKSFGAIRIETSFVENYKDCTICAILRENTLFCLAATEAKTCCAMPNAIQCPKIMQIPLGDQKVIFIAQKVAFLSVAWKFHCMAKIILPLCL